MDASKSSRPSPCTYMQIGFFNRTTNSLDMRVALSTCSNCPAIDNGTHAARCEVCHFCFRFAVRLQHTNHWAFQTHFVAQRSRRMRTIAKPEQARATNQTSST